ncbi:hypothetical protein I7I50_03251 [Histoplasma capsulatum G186AR]|uniref:Uncharacterized protein n=1 Tax=Ajellomyces capsulatus TaxID=5037 RepID=A0A8H8D5D3_AJECA|nr:hypothetical protein I7I52_00080 [Histoplasma capsulatum]QSS72166.1 hypothetical protein I7I50_03251 [Histoplasma capsulatum G186AR]
MPSVNVCWPQTVMVIGPGFLIPLHRVMSSCGGFVFKKISSPNRAASTTPQRAKQILLAQMRNDKSTSF